MSEKPLFCRRFRDTQKERETEALARSDLPRHSDAGKEHRAMPFEHYVGESSPNINTEQNANWKPLGAVAARLVRRAGK